MGRKTKKEKIAADNRRRFRPDTFQISETFSPKQSGVSLHSVVQQFSAPVTGDNNASAMSQNSYAYVAADLKRIFTFTALAFCAQLVLWYFLK